MTCPAHLTLLNFQNFTMSFSPHCLIMGLPSIKYINKLFFLWLCRPARAMASSFHEVFDHTQRRATVGRTPLGRVTSSSQRPLSDITQHTQQ
jgi:hypothetical protein